MNKLILIPLFILHVLVMKTKAQTFEPLYFRQDFMQYKGAFLKINDNISDINYNSSLYCSFENLRADIASRWQYDNKSNNYNISKDSLANRIFLVENIIDLQQNTINESSTFKSNPVFVLKDTLNNNVVYLYYQNSEYQYKFPFYTFKNPFDENYFCSNIERKEDDFTGEISFNSPITDILGISPVIIYKLINKTKTTYILHLHADGETVNVNKTGVTLLFTDGTKWIKSVKIDVTTDKYGYKYSAFIPLTTNDLTTFSTKRIWKFRLFIYDESISPEDSYKFKIYVKCIKDAK